MKISLNKLITCLILVLNVASYGQDDYGQSLPGQLDSKTSPYEDDNYKIKEEDGTQFENIFGASPQGYTEEELKNANMSEKDKAWLKSASDEDSILKDPSPDSYVEYRDEDMIKKSYQVSNSQLSLSYIYDTFDYKDSSGTFEKTFQSDNSNTKSVQAGYLFGSYKSYFQRNIVSTFFQINLGVSYNSGKGSFDDGTLSRTTFNFWLIPIDLNLGAKLNFGRSFSISLQGGPTIAPIWQNRDDRESGDDDKDIRQVGYGYNASASFDISVYNLFPSLGQGLKSTSGVTDMSFSIIARTMNISSFKKEDFEVSGASFGIGFNFEYL